MKLTRIVISNFKSIPSEGLEITFTDRIAVLVGKNNAGKSNILEALALLFGSKNPRYIRLEQESFNDPSKPLVIQAELEGLTWGDGKALGLSDQQCGGLTHEGKRVLTAPGHVTLRLTVPALSARADDQAASEDQAEEAEEASSRQTFEVLLANRHELKRNEDLRKAVVRHILVPPVRAHSDLLSPTTWTAYGRLLRDILADSPKTEELVGMINQATDSLQGILAEEARALTCSAKSTAYVDTVDFRLTKDGNPLELLRNLSLAVTYGGRTEDISAVGTGTQSAVIIGVLELCLRHRARRGIRLFSVEEPELFLHPHAQRYLARLLREIASEEGNHVILTTHSPCILPDLDVLDVVRVDRATDGGTRCLRVPADWRGLDAASRILNSETCEMVFADRAVLVEGPSEARLLPRLAEIVPTADGDDATCSLDRLNVSVINVGGKDHFRPYTELLECLGIEWRIITDADALVGEALAPYRERAGISAEQPDKEKRKALAQAGVLVLSRGEIEDYYPASALAEIAGCVEDEVAAHIASHKASFDEPTVCRMVEAVIHEHHQAICSADLGRLPKLASAWYSQTLEKLRKAGALQSALRGTGEALERWLKLPKPAIAARVAAWFSQNPDKVDKFWAGLVRWLVSGLVAHAEETA